ncbi:hypothetical protein NXY00_24245 [Bacteroides sp. BFG-551]|nr:hypothetical protein [Bacteroides sp. BFG-551]
MKAKVSKGGYWDRERKTGCCMNKYGKSEEHLVVGYSDGRAVKDAHNRERGIIRLRKIYASGSLTKDKLTRRWGYSKFFEISY